jgi:hypothetical protein
VAKPGIWNLRSLGLGSKTPVSLLLVISSKIIGQNHPRQDSATRAQERNHINTVLDFLGTDRLLSKKIKLHSLNSDIFFWVST